MFILKIAAVITFLMYLSAKMKTGFHMLQQESYLNLGYLKWVKKNLSKNISIYDFLPGIAALCVLSFTSEFYAYFIWCAVNLIEFYYRIKNAPKAKKPLVLTSRVKRLIVTGIVFSTGIGVVVFLGLDQFPVWTILGCMAFLAVSFLYIAFINIVNRPIELSVNRWYVNDARKRIGSMSGLRVVGITGSYGKTSSKFILGRILSEKYHTLITPESYNTTMGVVRTIREQMKPTHEVFVCEMGAKYVNDIKEICDLVHPEFGVITSIGPQHLETFGSLENIIKTKFELVDALQDKGKAVLNVSSAPVKEHAPKQAATYGIDASGGAQYYAEEIQYGPSGASFMFCGKDVEPFRLETRLLGKHNILNIVGAVSVALKLGLTPQEIAYAVKRLEPVPHRLQMKRQVGGVTVIDDAFNSNVEGASSAVEVLGSFPEGGRMLITPGMVELGEKEFEYNFAFGKEAAKYCDFIILVGEKQTVPIHGGLEKAGYPKERLYVAKDLNDALVKMREQAGDGWTVLFENDLPDLYL